MSVVKAGYAHRDVSNGSPMVSHCANNSQ
ncbi:protein of unknown function [Azospirillum baldaniorum]|uniref:Uncharacterized protein n=1 Tax=Azospirillum baldaniorum TaxID=1064539 RepID=A0A9P1JNX0_9PROT|nr:protein of unknown function [Azospirillum baldaniorum]